MALNIDAKFKENWLLLHKCMEEFEKFSPEQLKVSNWDFDGLFLSEVENLWAKNLQGVICHDNEEWCKIEGGIDL